MVKLLLAAVHVLSGAHHLPVKIAAAKRGAWLSSAAHFRCTAQNAAGRFIRRDEAGHVAGRFHGLVGISPPLVRKAAFLLHAVVGELPVGVCIEFASGQSGRRRYFEHRNPQI